MANPAEWESLVRCRMAPWSTPSGRIGAARRHAAQPAGRDEDGHAQASDLHDERCQRVPVLRGEGREEGPDEGGGRRGHLLADRVGPHELEAQLANEVDFETFFADAPHPNPARSLITGVICGIRVETIEEPTMREIRYLDKLVDELARGKAMERVLRKRRASDNGQGR